MADEYKGQDRRKTPVLTDEQIEHIAQRAAELAVQKMTTEVYAAVGKSVLHKIFWAMTIGNVGIKELLK
jgi:isocitrate/isopropylmalate dehydrogenase